MWVARRGGGEWIGLLVRTTNPTQPIHDSQSDLAHTQQDRQFFPVLIKQARRGRMKYGLGDGKNVADFVFVKNVAHAHLLAAEKVGFID